MKECHCPVISVIMGLWIRERNLKLSRKKIQDSIQKQLYFTTRVVDVFSQLPTYVFCNTKGAGYGNCVCDLSSEGWLICHIAHERGRERGHCELRNKRELLFFQEISHLSSLFVIGSQALLFSIDLKWNKIQLKQCFDTADP